MTRSFSSSSAGLIASSNAGFPPPPPPFKNDINIDSRMTALADDEDNENESSLKPFENSSTIPGVNNFVSPFRRPFGFRNFNGPLWQTFWAIISVTIRISVWPGIHLRCKLWKVRDWMLLLVKSNLVLRPHKELSFSRSVVKSERFKIKN